MPRAFTKSWWKNRSGKHPPSGIDHPRPAHAGRRNAAARIDHPGVGDGNFLVTGLFPAGELQRAIATVPTLRSTTPKEVGQMVVYLCSEAATNLVGQTIFLDGGHSIR